ncbi:MAG: DUF6446 family protein [Deltaproteobacteria bacterium]
MISAILAGVGVWYTQNYAYYQTIAADAPEAQMTMVPLGSETPETIPADNVQAIDGDSSPIKFRACFTTPTSLATLTETYQTFADPTPNFAPGWFDCFDAQAIGEALEKGEAVAFLSVPLIHPETDRVIAVFPDGRAYAWHQLRPEEKTE